MTSRSAQLVPPTLQKLLLYASIICPALLYCYCYNTVCMALAVVQYCFISRSAHNDAHKSNCNLQVS